MGGGAQLAGYVLGPRSLPPVFLLGLHSVLGLEFTAWLVGSPVWGQALQWATVPSLHTGL